MQPLAAARIRMHRRRGRDHRSLHETRRPFDDYEFVPRVLVDISKRTTACTLF